MAGLDENGSSASDDLGADPELNAILKVHTALERLNAESRERVLDYVCQRLNIHRSSLGYRRPAAQEGVTGETEKHEQDAQTFSEPGAVPPDNDLEGISPVALKWLRRNSLSAGSISNLFSLGIDDIDLVVDKVPGNSKRERARNVVKLVAIASYLATGAARASHERIKEACLHYDAYDSPNFAKALRDMEGEIAGTKESGYTLTPRGITAATALIKEMIA